MTLDDRDRHISRILAREGWISNLDLAECVAFSPSATLRRVQALGPAGVIAGCRAVLSPDKMGVGFVAWLAVGLSDHSKRSQVAFERAMQGAAAVRECHNFIGTVEYLLRVEVTNLRAQKRFHTDILGALPQVPTITTCVVMGSPKDDRV